MKIKTLFIATGCFLLSFAMLVPMAAAYTSLPDPTITIQCQLRFRVGLTNNAGPEDCYVDLEFSSLIGTKHYATRSCKVLPGRVCTIFKGKLSLLIEAYNEEYARGPKSRLYPGNAYLTNVSLMPEPVPFCAPPTGNHGEGEYVISYKRGYNVVFARVIEKTKPDRIRIISADSDSEFACREPVEIP